VGAGNVFSTSPTGHAWITLGALNFSIVPDWFRLPQTSGWVTCVAFSKDGNHLFAGTSNGNLYHYANLRAAADSGEFVYPSSTSTVTDWNADSAGIVTTSVLIGTGRYLRSISVDPTNPNNVVVTAARYGSSSYVWRSTNATVSPMTFSDITDNLPPMPVWCSLVDGANPNRILIGTDLGVYARDISTGEGWSEENSGMARVPVMTIKQIPYNGSSNYLYIGTYGRGIFRSASFVGINETPSVINEAMVFPNPVFDKATLRMNLASASSVEVKIFDLEGRMLQHIQKSNMHRGENTLAIDARNLNAGTYIVNIIAGSSSFNRKMVVIK
jgi:WD40 repeat protein